MIDNILKNVVEAKDYTGKAVAELQKEKEIHKTSRQVKYILLRKFVV